MILLILRGNIVDNVGLVFNYFGFPEAHWIHADLFGLANQIYIVSIFWHSLYVHFNFLNKISWIICYIVKQVEITLESFFSIDEVAIFYGIKHFKKYILKHFLFTLIWNNCVFQLKVENYSYRDLWRETLKW